MSAVLSQIDFCTFIMLYWSYKIQDEISYNGTFVRIVLIVLMFNVCFVFSPKHYRLHSIFSGFIFTFVQLSELAARTWLERFLAHLFSSLHLTFVRFVIGTGCSVRN